LSDLKPQGTEFMMDDDSPDTRLAELLRLAEDLHKSFADKPEMERAAACAVLAVKRMMADDDEAAAVYLRALRDMIALENIEPEPDEKMH